MAGTTISKMEMQEMVQCTRSLLKVVLALDTRIHRVVMAGDSMCALMNLRRQEPHTPARDSSALPTSTEATPYPPPPIAPVAPQQPPGASFPGPPPKAAGRAPVAPQQPPGASLPSPPPPLPQRQTRRAARVAADRALKVTLGIPVEDITDV